MAILFSLSLNMCWHTLSWVPKKLHKFTFREAPRLLQWKGEIPLLPHASAFQSAVEPQYNEPLYNEVLSIMNDFLYPSNSKIQSNLYITALYTAVTRQLPKILPYTFCKGSHLATSQGWPLHARLTVYEKEPWYNGTSLLGTNFAIPLVFHYLEAPL